MQDSIRVPKDRIAVIIGEKGSIKKKLEKKTSTRIRIDSDEGNITVSGGDGLDVLLAKKVVQAIARGFNPETAELLLLDEYHFEIVDISEFCRNKNDLRRVKARVIGSEGKARKMLETLTRTSIVVYGKTVGIIGGIAETDIARRAVSSLLNGSKHGNIYAMIAKEKKKMEEDHGRP